MALSIDLRKRVIAAVDAGMRRTDAAKSFQVGRKTIYRWLNLRKKLTGLCQKLGIRKGIATK